MQPPELTRNPDSERNKEIKSQKKDIMRFQKTFPQMKAEIYKLRAENKVFQLDYVKPDIKDKESNELKITIIAKR